ncbi:MAG: triose-phosphate isomerase, partial [Pseudomonadales bacterium]|nr:triose-phosphate isomerase [Pseudomonadales bacterium]
MTNRLVIANWKMNGNLAFAKALASSLPSSSNVQTVVVPPAVYAHRLVELSEGAYEVGLQNVGRYGSGAHTGEISAEMARDV